MTDLAYACAALELPVDPGRLYDNEDPYFHYWLAGLVDRLAARRRRENAELKAKRKS